MKFVEQFDSLFEENTTSPKRRKLSEINSGGSGEIFEVINIKEEDEGNCAYTI